MNEEILRQIISDELHKISSETLPEVLTLDQACKYLQVSDTWLKANLIKLKIPFFKTGRHYKFNLEDLREWTRGYQQQKRDSKVKIKATKTKTNDMRVSL